MSILEADLAQAGAAEKVASWCDAEGLAPDILINDAGMFFMKYLSPEMLPKVRTMMNLHMDAATELCILLGARMKERGRGWICRCGYGSLSPERRVAKGRKNSRPDMDPRKTGPQGPARLVCRP